PLRVLAAFPFPSRAAVVAVGRPGAVVRGGDADGQLLRPDPRRCPRRDRRRLAGRDALPAGSTVRLGTRLVRRDRRRLLGRACLSLPTPPERPRVPAQVHASLRRPPW